MLERPEAAQPGTVDAEAAVRLISQYRVDHGLKPLKLDPTLMKLAAEHAQRMASMDRMSHSLPGEGSFSQRIAAGGFQASMAAENVAAGQKIAGRGVRSLAQVAGPQRQHAAAQRFAHGHRARHPAGRPLPHLLVAGTGRALRAARRRAGARSRTGARIGIMRSAVAEHGWAELSRADRATGGHWRAPPAPPAPPPAPIVNSVPPPGGPSTKVAMPLPLRPQPVDHRVIGGRTGIDQRHRRSENRCAGASSMSCTPGENCA